VNPSTWQYRFYFDSFFKRLSFSLFGLPLLADESRNELYNFILLTATESV